MAVKYKLIQRPHPLKRDEPPKTYALAVQNRTIGARELAQDIERIASVSRADIMAVIECLLDLIPKHLANSNRVRLGDFGTYSIGLSSEGRDNADVFSHYDIRKVKVNFRPGALISKTLAQASFVRVD